MTERQIRHDLDSDHPCTTARKQSLSRWVADVASRLTAGLLYCTRLNSTLTPLYYWALYCSWSSLLALAVYFNQPRAEHVTRWPRHTVQTWTARLESAPAQTRKNRQHLVCQCRVNINDGGCRPCLVQPKVPDWIPTTQSNLRDAFDQKKRDLALDTKDKETYRQCPSRLHGAAVLVSTVQYMVG